MKTISRRLRSYIPIAMLAFAPIAGAQTTRDQPKEPLSTIVFVCEHGSAKSVIAAAHFNKLASEKGLPYRAISRGMKPDEAINPAVSSGLAAEGLDVSTWHPKAIGDNDVRLATKVVSISTGLPAAKPSVKNKLIEWNEIPPLSENYEASSRAIVQHVEKLVESLAPAPNPSPKQ